MTKNILFAVVFWGGVLFSLNVAGQNALPTPAAPASLQVSVLSSLGKPLPAVEVFFYSLTTPSEEEPSPCRDWDPIRAEASSQSLYGKTLAPGPYRVEVNADGWQPEVVEEVKLNPGEEKKLEFKLKPGNTIAGRVVDEAGMGVPRATVSYWSSDRSIPRLFASSREITTDRDGSFRFGSLKEGIYNLTASLPGYVKNRMKDVATGEENLEVVLKKGFTIKGKLIGETGEISGNVRLKLKKLRGQTSSRKVPLEEANTFVISDLEEVAYDVRVKDGDYISDDVRNVRAVAPEEAVPILLTVYKGAVLSGRVLESGSGEPLKGVWLRLSPVGSKKGASKTSDQEGKYSFPSLAPGDYELKARLSIDSYSDWRFRKKVSLTAGEEITDFDFEIDAGRMVAFSGMVVDEKGRPVADAKVRLHCRRPEEKSFRSDFRGDVETDESGYFAFSSFLDGEMEIKLSAAKKGFASVQGELILLAPDRKSVDGTVLKLNAGNSLRVEAVDAEGKSIPQAKLILEKDWFAARETVTSFLSDKKLGDAQGRCRFENLPAGHYQLRVKKDGYAEEKEKIELGEEGEEREVRVVLNPGRDLRVRVVDSSDEPVPGARVEVRPASRNFFRREVKAETDAAGACYLSDLPRKTLLLRVEADGYSSLSRQEVEPDRVDIEIVLKDSGVITGRLLGPDGKAVDEADIRLRLKGKSPFDYTSFFFSSKQLLRLGDGKFKAVDLKPGNYTVTVKAPGLGYRVFEKVAVKVGEETDLGEIKLSAEGRLAGRVLKADDGSPLRQARVSIKNPDQPSSVGFSRVDFSGRFEVDKLSTGVYKLTVSAEGYRRKEIDDISVSVGEVKELPAVKLEKLTDAEKEEIERERNLIPSLGVRVKREEFPEHLSDIKIGELVEGGAAAAAGLQPGDIIRRIDGKTSIEDPGVYMKGLLAKPGTKVKLSVIRKGKKEEEVVEVTIGEWDYEEIWKALEE